MTRVSNNNPPTAMEARNVHSKSTVTVFSNRANGGSPSNVLVSTPLGDLTLKPQDAIRLGDQLIVSAFHSVGRLTNEKLISVQKQWDDQDVNSIDLMSGPQKSVQSANASEREATAAEETPLMKVANVSLSSDTEQECTRRLMHNFSKLNEVDRQLLVHQLTIITGRNGLIFDKYFKGTSGHLDAATVISILRAVCAVAKVVCPIIGEVTEQNPCQTFINVTPPKPVDSCDKRHIQSGSTLERMSMSAQGYSPCVEPSEDGKFRISLGGKSLEAEKLYATTSEGVYLLNRIVEMIRNTSD